MAIGNCVLVKISKMMITDKIMMTTVMNKKILKITAVQNFDPLLDLMMSSMTSSSPISFDSFIYPHIKLTDYISTHFVVIVKNVVISFKHEYRSLNLTLHCDVIADVISVENTFCGIICNDLFISSVKMNLSKIFRIFQIGRHCEVPAIFKTRNFTGSWV